MYFLKEKQIGIYSISGSLKELKRRLHWIIVLWLSGAKIIMLLL